MQRVTFSIDESLGQAFDDLIVGQGYESRSEAVRDLVRKAVDARRVEHTGGHCVANLSYVYDHHTRVLAQRLVEIAHTHHDLIVSTMHVHLDHAHCLETTILKGETARVRAFADNLRAERGVAFGELNLISIDPADGHEVPAHSHAGHAHLTPVYVADRSRP